MIIAWVSFVLLLLVQVDAQIRNYETIKKVNFTGFIDLKPLQSQSDKEAKQSIQEIVRTFSEQTRLDYQLQPIKNYYAPELGNTYNAGLHMNRFLLSVLIGSTMIVGWLMYMLVVKLLKWKKEKKLNRFTQTYSRKYQYTVGAFLVCFLLMNLVTSILVFIYVIKEYKADIILKNVVKSNMLQYEAALNSLEQIMSRTCTSNPRLNEFYIQISQCKVQPSPKFFDEQMYKNMVDIVKGSANIQYRHNWQIVSFVSEVLLFIFILISLAWITYAIHRKLQYQFQLSSYIYCFIAGISFMNIYFYSVVITKRVDICAAAMKHIGKTDYVINEGFFYFIPLYTTDTKVNLRRNQQYNYELTRFNIKNYLDNLDSLVNQNGLKQFQTLIDKSKDVQSIIKQKADPLYQQQYQDGQQIVKQNIDILEAIKVNNDAQQKFKFLIQNMPTQQMMVDLEKDYCVTSTQVKALSPKASAILRSFSLLGISILSQVVLNILVSKKLQKYKKQEINSVRKQLL